MNEYLTREQLAERWGVAPTEIEAIENCGLHATAVLQIGGNIDAIWAPTIHGTPELER